MKKQKKQSLLTFTIVILVIALAILLGTMAYEEAINMNKNETEQTSNPKIENEGKDEINNEEENKENEPKVEDNEIQNNQEENQEINNQENKDDVIEEKDKDEKKDEQEYVGEEEVQSKEETNSGKTIEEKAIDLAKKEWGNDASVTFNIEEKKGNKYYVSVKRNAITACWYEVDIETWEISEY